MTDIVPIRPFDDAEALAWLRSQPDGRVTASAAELGRQWGWNRSEEHTSELQSRP